MESLVSPRDGLKRTFFEVVSLKEHDFLSMGTFNFSITLLYVLISFAGITSEKSTYVSMFLLILVLIGTLQRIWTFPLNTNVYIAWLVYFIYYSTTVLITNDIGTSMKYIGYSLILFSPVWLFYYYTGIKNKRYIVKLLVFSLAVFFTFAIIALLYYSREPGAARSLAANRYAVENIAIGGGYGIAYGSSMLVVYFFDILRSNILKKKHMKWLLSAFIATLICLVVMTESTITIISMAIGLIISMFHGDGEGGKKKNKLVEYGVRKWYKGIIALVIIILLVMNLRSIGSFIVNKTAGNGNVVARRFSSIGFALVYDIGYVGDLSYRVTLPIKSLRTFLTSPIFGLGYKYGYSFAEGANYLGNHCEWADALGSMGLIGGVPFILVFLFTVKNERNNGGKYFYSSYPFVLLFEGLFNPFKTFQSMYTLMFIIPACTYVIVNESDLFYGEVKI